MKFCTSAGIPCEELNPDRYFKKGMCDGVIIPVLFEPLVRTSRATIPENESHIFRRFGATLGSIT